VRVCVRVCVGVCVGVLGVLSMLEARGRLPSSPRPRPPSPKSPRTTTAAAPSTPDRGGWALLPPELIDLVLLFVCGSPAQRLTCRRFAEKLRWALDMNAVNDPSRIARALMERTRDAVLRLNTLRPAMHPRDFDSRSTSVFCTDVYSHVYTRLYRICQSHQDHVFFGRGTERNARANRLCRLHNRLHREFAERVLPELHDDLVELKVVRTLTRLGRYLSKGFCAGCGLPDIGASLADLCRSRDAGHTGRYLLRLDRFARTGGTLDHWRVCVAAHAARHPDRDDLSFTMPFPRLVPCLGDAHCRAFALLEQDVHRTKTDAEMERIRALVVPTLAERANALAAAEQ